MVEMVEIVTWRSAYEYGQTEEGALDGCVTNG